MKVCVCVYTAGPTELKNWACAFMCVCVDGQWAGQFFGLLPHFFFELSKLMGRPNGLAYPFSSFSFFFFIIIIIIIITIGGNYN